MGCCSACRWRGDYGRTRWHGRQADRGSGALLLMLFAAAPVLLVVAVYGLCSARIALPDARALKVAAIIVLAARAAVAGYQAIHVVFYTGAFSAELRPLGWRFLALEVVPSVAWAVVLALTSIPTTAPAAPHRCS